MHAEQPPGAHIESENTQLARDIVRNLEFIDKATSPDDLRYSRIIGLLEESHLLTSEIERVKKQYGENLGEFGATLSEDVWAMLTVLELFDVGTIHHCIETYHLAKNKIEHTFFKNSRLESFSLIDSFSKVGLPTFYRACLLHDIGKVEIPYSVVINRITDSDCADMLFAHKKEALLPALRNHTGNSDFEIPENIHSGEDLLAYLHDSLRTRPQALAPIRLLLGNMTEGDVEKISIQLAHCGRSLDDSLISIVRTHDDYSRKILEESGMGVEAVLAGSHHISTGQEYRILIGTLQVTVDLAHIIHLADVQNAIMSMRHYKPEQTPLEALKILAVHAQHGLVDSYIAYVWIADELNQMKDIEESERESYAYIANFLDAEKRNHLAYPEWRNA